MHLKDGRTDGQTNSFLVASTHWHSMLRGKNRISLYLHVTENVWVRIWPIVELALHAYVCVM